MSKRDQIGPFVANDNIPLTYRPRGDAVGFNAILRERQKNREARDLLELTNEDVLGNNVGLWLSTFIWLGFAGAALWSFYTSQSIGTRILCTIGVIWTGLWTRFLALDHLMPRHAELSLLSTLVGFLGLMTTASLQMGYPLSLPGGIVTLISASLVVSVINSSRIALMCAIGCGLIWAALQFDGFMETGSYGLILPALWTLTVLQAIRLKTMLGVVVSVITGYIWLTGSAYQAYEAGNITGLYLGAGAVVIGSLHYRTAKAAEDVGLPLTEWNVTLGWVVANLGLLCVAKFGLDPTAAIWSDSHDVSSITRIAWIAVLGGAVLAYAIASIIRARHKMMSGFGVILTTVLLACLPIAILFLPTLEPQFQAMTGLAPYPAVGLFIFGLVIGHILFFISNAFRRAHYFQVTAALIVASVMAYLVSGVDLVFQENWVLLLLGTMASALVSLIAVEPQLATNSDLDMPQSVSSS